MADLHKEINTGKPLGGELKNTLDNLATAMARFDALKRIMDAASDGSTYATVEAIFGLPAGSGADVVYQMALVSGELSGATVLHQMLEQFGAIVRIQ